MRGPFIVAIACTLGLSGCSQGLYVPAAGTGTPADDAETNVPLTFTVAVGPALGGVQTITVTATPANGSTPPVVTQAACSSTSCSITAQAPPEDDTVTIALGGGGGATLATGELDVDAAAAGRAVIGVAFGGTPAGAVLSLDPAELTIGAAASAQLSIVAYDAAGNQLIGDAPFGTPVAVGETDATGDTTLSATAFASPAQTIAVNYDGADVPAIDFVPSTAGGGDVELNFDAAPHANAASEAEGDLVFPTVRRQRWVAIAPDVPPALPSTPAATALHRYAAPSQVDLSVDMPPIGDQHQTEACTAWSSSYSILTYYYALQRRWRLTGSGPGGIDTAHVFSPAYVWNDLNGGNNVGLNPLDVLAFIKKHGGVFWKAFPWKGEPSPKPDRSIVREGRPYRALGYFRLGRDRAKVKAYVQNGYPIFWGVHLDRAFDAIPSVAASAAIPRWHPNTAITGRLGGHAMVIVGYDDSLGSFIFRNSWGAGFGRGGYALVSYADFENKHVTAFAYAIDPRAVNP